MSKTPVIVIHPERPEPEVVARAAAVLLAGGLVAFPTETVYGLGALALEPRAVRRIFEAKGRPSADPLIVHVLEPADIDPLVASPGTMVATLSRFWPGPLTLVLPRSERVPLEVTAGLPNVAVRVPAHPVARALLAAVQAPIAAPSANLFTRPSPTEAHHVVEDLDGRIDLILDGGPTSHGLESTVVDLSVSPPRLLRPGALTVEQLLEVLPALEIPGPLYLDAGVAALPSPGTHLKHYSPRARVVVVHGQDPQKVRAGCLEEVTRALAAGTRVGVMGPDELIEAFAGLEVARASLGPAGALEEAGSRFFGALRALDAAQVALIVAPGFGAGGLGRALQDRLVRAAEGRVLDVDQVREPSR